ncbi:MAG TPA: hypothetical protein VN761_09060 [Candidatus Polarisedimenticolia bacterium]|nr:hypothetical protein [Candidatus Polarisedimenticolia bacterium]
MKVSNKAKRRAGYAMVIVLVFCAIGLALLAASLNRSSDNSALTNRRNSYYDAMEASEAATEKVIAELTSDFLNSGAATVSGKSSVYKTRIPNSSENARWNKFQFKDQKGNKDSTEVDLIADWASTNLISQYQGLSGYAATYRITSYAQSIQGRYKPSAAVQQDIQLAVVPVFQFTIFYNMDMEICPGPNMTVKGRVHSNGNLYAQPQAQLTFMGDVTSALQIVAGKSPNDPSIRTPGTITFNAEHDGGVNSLNLPLGTNNSPAAVHAIIEIPPNSESPNSQMGQQRLYNQADLIILVNDGSVDMHGGNNVNGNGAVFNWSSDTSKFVNTNVSFYDYREGKTIKTTQIDVGKMNTWFKGQSKLKGLTSVYVADLRSQNSATEPGIRLTNGMTLPSTGLTVATPDPLYVEGNYNVDSTQVGTANTSKSQPAALVADSINVLSGNWSDANSSKALNNRIATATTVNAAFLAGIVPSGNGYYSGGVENFPRFLEDWSSKTFTYNGSMVVMFPSQIGSGTWKGTGGNYYNPPVRAWNFDVNFSDPNKLPPITPRVSTAIRGQWVSISGN